MYKRFFFVVGLAIFAQILSAKTTIKVVDQQTISDKNHYLIAPKWSPNGQYIAAAGISYGSIWLYDTGDSTWSKLIEQNGCGWGFDWSPDSRKIAFRANVFKDKRKITTIKHVDILTKKVTTVIDYTQDLSTPKWISDHEVGFMEDGDFRSIIIKDKRLEKLSKVSKKEDIALFSHSGVYTKKANQSPVLLEALTGQTFHVSFSPDGNEILYQKSGGKIYKTGKKQEAIFIADGEMPSWSPNGDFIVYATPKDDGHQITSSDIMVCDKNGSHKIKLTDTENEFEMNPDWSPDGHKIACDSNGKILIIFLKTE